MPELFLSNEPVFVASFLPAPFRTRTHSPLSFEEMERLEQDPGRPSEIKSLIGIQK